MRQPFLFHPIEVSTMQDRNATVAVAAIGTKVGRKTATGSSKRNKGEVFDDSAGRRMAIGRALVNLGREMMESVK